jgi:2Fe-2S ferredoxin
VYIDPADSGRPPAPSPLEREMLDGVAAPRRPESRLSCQITATAELDGLVVHIPETQY